MMFHMLTCVSLSYSYGIPRVTTVAIIRVVACVVGDNKEIVTRFRMEARNINGHDLSAVRRMLVLIKRVG